MDVDACLILFAAAFGAATVLPLPSEVPFAYVVLQSGDFTWPVAVATCGNYLGACTTYGLARFAVKRFVPEDGARWAYASAVIRRFGAPVLLLSWVPVVGDACVAVAGAVGMPFGRFSLYTAVGKATRYAVLAWKLWVRS